MPSRRTCTESNLVRPVLDLRRFNEFYNNPSPLFWLCMSRPDPVDDSGHRGSHTALALRLITVYR